MDYLHGTSAIVNDTPNTGVLQSDIQQQNQSSDSRGNAADDSTKSLKYAKGRSDKEHEPVALRHREFIKEVSVPESTVPVELSHVGVKVHPENVEIPPDLKMLGVSQSGASQQFSYKGSMSPSTVVLPISDDQIIAGLHMSLVNSIRWLAEWCAKQLRRAHLCLKVVHGKVTRVQTR